MNNVLRLQLQVNPDEVEADAPISTISEHHCGGGQVEISPA
ncbi:hypothetical protein [Amycolatopsis sp. 195334CR]|nr:hypothetical protein [Amycolatopsis sp. 195334CR]